MIHPLSVPAVAVLWRWRVRTPRDGPELEGCRNSIYHKFNDLRRFFAAVVFRARLSAAMDLGTRAALDSVSACFLYEG